jgi:hypothetical protein
MKEGLLRHPFLRRVPVVLLLGAGALLWRSTLFPQPRTLVWDLPPAPVAVVRAEVQLWQGTALVARAEWPLAPHGALVQQLQLRSGTYRALSFLQLADGHTEQHSQTLHLGSEETVHLGTLPR